MTTQSHRRTRSRRATTPAINASRVATRRIRTSHRAATPAINASRGILTSHRATTPAIDASLGLRTSHRAATSALGTSLLYALVLAACTEDLGLDRRRFACESDDDCARGTICDLQLRACTPPGSGPPDAGLPDVGARDARPDTGAGDLRDTGPRETGPRDARPDAGVDPPDTGPAVIDLSAGLHHTCALFADGRARCWGGNSWAQLGLGFSSPAPIETWQEVPNLENIVELEAGAWHTCVRQQNGDIRCWGKNILGQSGSPTTIPTVERPSEPIVQGATDLIVGRGQTTCALVAGGQALCWGLAIDGRDWCGDDCGPAITTPTPIPALTSTQTVTALALGTYHACAVAGGRELFCWGNNYFGEVGDGTIGTERPNPVRVSIGTPLIAVGLGDHESCALVGTEQLCWGNWPPHMPGDFGLPNVLEVELGFRHGCSRLTGGEIVCWGDTTYGQAGYLPNGGWRVPAGPIDGLTGRNVRALAVGAQHSCALTEAGEIRCWGHNDYLQLGRFTIEPFSSTAERVQFQDL